MADEPMNLQPISDDQELAKVLAGVSQQADDAAAAPVVAAPVLTTPEPALEPVVAPAPAVTTLPVNTELDTIKSEALNELRPLVGKLDVSPEERFDTYLLLLRSTDDKDLIAPAHEAAKSISDEARRAQALLDIIKEIDFLSQK